MMKQVTCPKCKGKKAIKKRLGSAIEFTLCQKCGGKGEIAVPYTKEERLALANQFIETIASCGRKFFIQDGRISKFEIGEGGKLYFFDSWQNVKIYTSKYPAWRGFSWGWMMQDLVLALRNYILGKSAFEFPMTSSEWYAGKDPWDYKDDMDKVREASKKLVL